METGDNVLIGGFIVTGTQPKKVIVRAIGPSLSALFAGALADPILELRDSSGALIRSNDNWRTDQEAEIIASTIPPSDDLESAIVATLPANGSAYTAIVRGANNGTGIGVVEVYDLNQAADSELANISTRGLVQTGDNVLIGGMIVLGQSPLRVIVRAIGPSLPVTGALADPTLELRDGNGGLIDSNDNWRSDHEAEIIATTIPPSNDLESAIVRNLAPGNYTAIIRGVNNTTGVAARGSLRAELTRTRQFPVLGRLQCGSSDIFDKMYRASIKSGHVSTPRGHRSFLAALFAVARARLRSV